MQKPKVERVPKLAQIRKLCSLLENQTDVESYFPDFSSVIFVDGASILREDTIHTQVLSSPGVSACLRGGHYLAGLPRRFSSTGFEKVPSEDYRRVVSRR